MKPFNQIYKHKGSDTAIFLGCGTSINKITDEQWEVISKFDVWTSNNFIYHDFIPKFYHVELKLNRNFEIWKNWRQNIKGEKYDDIIFIIEHRPKRKRKFVVEAVNPESKYIYKYTAKRINVKARGITPNYKISSKYITNNCCASFTMILEMLYKFKYKRVILFGVDLKDSRYFWTEETERIGKNVWMYRGERVHCATNKHRKQNQPHNTYRLVPYIIAFDKKYMRKIGCQLFTGHKETLIHPGLKYIDILKM